jgi:hypothetical protein
VTKAEIIEFLNDLERTLPVSEWRVCGFRVWPFIRFELYESNFNPMFAGTGLAGGWRARLSLLARGLAGWARARLTDRRANQKRDQPADAVFLAYSIGTQPTVDGRRYNPLLAPYVDLLTRQGRRSVVWEMAPFGEYNTPRAIPSCYIQPYLTWLRLRHLRAQSRPAEIQLEGYDRFVGRVTEQGLQSRYLTLATIWRDAYFVRRLADGFKRWLGRVRPTIGFTADYSLREHAFCLACRELDIRSVDLQHGVQGELHPTYGSWERVPAEGYEVKPTVHWCWDEASAEAINRWADRGSGIHRAIAAGDPWREAWLDGGQPFVRAFDAELSRWKRKSSAELHVLVTLDTIGDIIPPFVLDAFRRSPRSWCYWLRLHPVNQRVRRPLAAAVLARGEFAAMDLDAVAQWPLHAILRQVDAHLTISWSSVILEAEAFGVPSIACDTWAGEVYRTQVERGTLRVALSNTALALELGRVTARRGRPQQPRRPGPDEVMRQLLNGGPEPR